MKFTSMLIVYNKVSNFLSHQISLVAVHCLFPPKQPTHFLQNRWINCEGLYFSIWFHVDFNISGAWPVGLLMPMSASGSTWMIILDRSPLSKWYEVSPVLNFRAGMRRYYVHRSQKKGTWLYEVKDRNLNTIATGDAAAPGKNNIIENTQDMDRLSRQFCFLFLFPTRDEFYRFLFPLIVTRVMDDQLLRARMIDHDR